MQGIGPLCIFQGAYLSVSRTVHVRAALDQAVRPMAFLESVMYVWA